jgi:6-phosphofructokinase 1
VFFIEVMGRDAGFIALYAGIASGAEKVLIPERNEQMEDLEKTLKRASSAKKTSNIILVAEGDQTGGAYDIAKKTQEIFPDYDIKVTILGHIQRGGSPSYFDRLLASRMGVKAVEYLMLGRTGIMVGIQNNQIITPRLEDAIKQHTRLDQELLKVAEITAI